MRAFSLLFSMFVITAIAHADTMTPEKLWDLARIGDAVVSPDGKSIAYLVTRYDLAENEGTVSVLLQPLPQTLANTDEKKATAFETPLQTAKAKTLLKGIKGLGSLDWLNHSSGAKLVYIAPGEEGETAENGKAKSEIVEESKQEKTKPQVWMLDPNGGEPKQLTTVEQGVANLKASPSGDAIAFTVDVKMDKEVTEIYEDLPKADARIIDSLMYRHWNAWHDYAYSHLHTAMIDEEGNVSEPVDLMPSLKADCPLPPFGGREQFAFSPDGKQIALTIKLVNNPAESTDSNLYLVDTAGGTLRNMTPGMPGYDMDPAYSPDGRYIAFHSMKRAGFEADRNRIMLYDRNSGEIDELTKGIDQTAHRATWSSDSKRVYFDSETRGTHQVFSIDLNHRQLNAVSSGRFNFKVIAVTDGSENNGTSERVIVTQENMLRPTELGIVDPASKQVTTMTDVNGAIFAKLDLPTIEERFFTATDGKQIHNWVIFPPDYSFDSGSKSEAGSTSDSVKQWPMLTYCQGGPQGQIGQWFSYRWNFHMMAAKGYVVLAVNRRGMPGFGQEWNDQISGDWGGQAMQDILASTDAMIADPKIDPSRVAAIGASFGGYTVYWLMGNGANRFCSMIAHCGVFNLESMYGSTEELFFVNHDLGGPYWKSEKVAANYERFSPHQFAGSWKTPLLVIHGERDFRVPVTQGMEAFTAAQVQGVDSRFLYFPEEGHWVLSPQNGVLWGRVFFDWLDQHCQNQE